MPRKRPTTEAEWERKRAEDRARYHANPGPATMANKKWSQKNRDHINEARRKWRALHKKPKIVRVVMSKEERIASVKKAHRKYYLSQKAALQKMWSTPEYRAIANAYRRNKKLSDPIWAERQAEKRRALRGYPGPKKPTMSKAERLAAKQACGRNHRTKNKEGYAFRGKQWRKNNAAEYKAYLRAYYQKNKIEMLAKISLWKKANRDKVRASCAARDARKKATIHPDSDKRKMDAIFSETARMSRVTGVEHETDHIIPTAKKGWHHQDNLQSLPASINGAKQDNPFWLAPSPQYKDWRDVPRELWPVDLVPKYLALLEQHKGESIRWDVAA